MLVYSRTTLLSRTAHWIWIVSEFIARLFGLFVRLVAALIVIVVKKMCADNRASLEVSYIHLSKSSSQIAVSLVDAPSEMLEVRCDSLVT